MQMRKVQRQLPHAARSMHLYELSMSERAFQRHDKALAGFLHHPVKEKERQRNKNTEKKRTNKTVRVQIARACVNWRACANWSVSSVQVCTAFVTMCCARVQLF